MFLWQADLLFAVVQAVVQTHFLYGFWQPNFLPLFFQPDLLFQLRRHAIFPPL